MKTKPRAECIKKMMDVLGMKEPYASTIYATHRKQCKDAGVYTTVYRILDVRDGKRIKPYISTRDVFKTKEGDHVTLVAARRAYISSQNKSIKAARALIIKKPKKAARAATA